MRQQLASQVIISFDVEADGPIPIHNSMRSIGLVAYNEFGEEIDTFYAVLNQLPEAAEDVDTMTWWATQDKKVYDEVFNNPSAIDPELACGQLILWLQKFGHYKFMANPAGFDFTFLRVYMTMYYGVSNKWHNCIDMRSFAAAVLSDDVVKFGGNIKAEIKRRMNLNFPHTHNALDDAREQGACFFALIKLRQFGGHE